MQNENERARALPAPPPQPVSPSSDQHAPAPEVVKLPAAHQAPAAVTGDSAPRGTKPEIPRAVQPMHRAATPLAVLASGGLVDLVI